MSTAEATDRVDLDEGDDEEPIGDLKEHKNLATAVSAVMADVSYIRKKYSDALRYSIAGEGAIIRKLRPSLVRHGLVILPTSIRVVGMDDYQTKNNSIMQRCRIVVTYDMIHAASGERHKVVAAGEGADTGDKCMSKAQTNAYKYMMLKAFGLETGDDPDNTPSAGQEAAPRGQPANQQNGRPPNRSGPPPGSQGQQRQQQPPPAQPSNKANPPATGADGKEHTESYFRRLNAINMAADGDKLDRFAGLLGDGANTPDEVAVLKAAIDARRKAVPAKAGPA